MFLKIKKDLKHLQNQGISDFKFFLPFSLQTSVHLKLMCQLTYDPYIGHFSITYWYIICVHPFHDQNKLDMHIVLAQCIKTKIRLVVNLSVNTFGSRIPLKAIYYNVISKIFNQQLQQSVGLGSLFGTCFIPNILSNFIFCFC